MPRARSSSTRPPTSRLPTGTNSSTRFATACSVTSTGHPPKVGRGLLERHVTDDMLTWQASGGFSIDASVHIAGRDRVGLERLLRYCARPPFALERLEANGYGPPGGERIVYRLPHPAPDGTTALSLTPLEFLERLALLIHPPRIHRAQATSDTLSDKPRDFWHLTGFCLRLPARSRMLTTHWGIQVRSLMPLRFALERGSTAAEQPCPFVVLSLAGWREPSSWPSQ